MVPVKTFSFYEAMSAEKKETKEEKAGSSGTPSSGGSGDGNNLELETTFTVSPKDPEPVDLGGTASAVNVVRSSAKLNLELVGIEPETEIDKSDKDNKNMTEDVVERCHAHRTEGQGQGDGGIEVDSPLLEALKQKFDNINLDDSILSGDVTEEDMSEVETDEDKQEEKEGVAKNKTKNKDDGTAATSFKEPIIIENNANLTGTDVEVEDEVNTNENRREKGKGCRCSII